MWTNQQSEAGQGADISISVVSHTQIQLIENLLHDLENYCRTLAIELILTINLAETLPFSISDFSFPIKIIYNSVPKGFAANHNQAFIQATGQFFCVINPDIRLNDNPFPPLRLCLENAAVGVAAPLVVSATGSVEDNARRLPTPLKILCKALGGCKGGDYRLNGELVFPDWVGGMFMLFPCLIFKKMGGFDPRYYLYYEDVDLCTRLRLQGYRVALCPNAKVVHHAHRSSHHNFKYLKWHIMSMMRFFCSRGFLQTFWSRLTKQCLQ